MNDRASSPVDDDDVPWGMLTTAPDGQLITTNARFANWAGRPPDALRRMCMKELLSPASRILHETHYVPLLAVQGYVNEVALELSRPDGSRMPVLVCAVARRVDGVDLVSVTIFDATETRRHERALLQARREAEQSAEALVRSNKALSAQKEELRVTLRSIADAVVTVDARGAVTSMNPTAEKLTQSLQGNVTGAPLQALGTFLHAGSRTPIDIATAQWTWIAGGTHLILQRGDGTERHVALTAAPIRDEADVASGLILVFRDVTDEQAAIRQLAYDASHDHLTGLCNRREFERRLALAQPADDAVGPVLCYLDIDQFKVVNDTAGHAAGDRLLVQIAALLGEGLRKSDTLARLGGDEFGILLQRCSLDEGLQIAEDLRQRLADHRFEIGGRAYAVTASVGVSVPRFDDGEVGDALKEADIACYAAKDSGRNRVNGMRRDDVRIQSRRGEMGWIDRIHRALDEDRFELQFQPIVAIADPAGSSGAIDHGEMLLRLRDDDGQLLGPGAFIAAAERYGRMQPIDRWVVRKSFAWLATIADLRISVNVSGESFGDPTFLQFVIDQFETTCLAPARVCFEITETAAIADLPAALSFITTLRALGARFALDDFGAGLSSFNYLRTLPVDFLKIDGSFVKTMMADPVSRAIVESFHRVARLCKLRTVAEWVEDAPTTEVLRDIGVDYAQGWHFGRPRPIEEVASPAPPSRDRPARPHGDERPPAIEVRERRRQTEQRVSV